MAAAQHSVLNSELKKLLDEKMNLYLESEVNVHTRQKTTVFTDTATTWETEFDPITISEDSCLEIPVDDDAQKTCLISAITHYLSQQATYEIVHPFVILSGRQVHLILSSGSRHALKMNPMKAYVEKQFLVGPLAVNEAGGPTVSSLLGEGDNRSDSTSSGGTNTPPPSSRSGSPSNSSTTGSSSVISRSSSGISTASSQMTPNSELSVSDRSDLTYSLVGDESNLSNSLVDDESNLLASSVDDDAKSLFYLTPRGLGSMTFLDDIVAKFVARGPHAENAVMIFTFNGAGDRWKMRPAIIVPSKLIPPIPAAFYTHRNSINEHDFVHEMMTYLANEIEKLEGRAPFISCIDFGPYIADCRAVDFVLSRHLHEAPLYLNGCYLRPSKKFIASMASTTLVPAQYHHRSCSSAETSFKTHLFVRRTHRDEFFPSLMDHLRTNDEDVMVAHCPPTTEPDLVKTVASRLGKKLKKHLDTLLELYWERCREDAHNEVVIFTNDADLWITDKTPVIICSEILPIPRTGYNHDKHDIAEDLTSYLVEKARLETGKRIVVTYIRFETREISYEVHLIFTRSFNGGAEYMKRVRNMLPLIAPVHCLSCLPSQPMVFTETLLWVRRQVGGEQERDVERSTMVAKTTQVYLEWKEWNEAVRDGVDLDDIIDGRYLSRPIITRLEKTMRISLNTVMKCFIEWQEFAGPLNVVFTKETSMWRPGGDWQINTGEPLSPTPTRYYEQISDVAGEITDYLRELADRLKMQPLNISCLQVERRAGSDIHLVLSAYDKPTLLQLGSCVLPYEREEDDDRFRGLEVSKGVYCYRSPVNSVHGGHIKVKVTTVKRGEVNCCNIFQPEDKELRKEDTLHLRQF